MSSLAKDIQTIYASYQIKDQQYIETTEDEIYGAVREKWLILKGLNILNLDLKNITNQLSKSEKNSPIQIAQGNR